MQETHFETVYDVLSFDIEGEMSLGREFDMMANEKQKWISKYLVRLEELITVEDYEQLEYTAEYLFEPLFFAMENFSRNESLFIDEKAMMCIEFIYDKNNKNIKRGDHDNKEVKQVIDAISAFVVPDDSDDYLSLCQISSEGEYNHTKVYVMPERCFGAFFSDHSKDA